MPRTARVVIPGCPSRRAGMTQRGNNRQDVFFVDDDRRIYLQLLGEYADRYGLEVTGYCLMTNHVHLVATPGRDDSLAKAMGRTHLRYTQYINRLHGRCGHLWQDRFFSSALDEQWFWHALVYAERNPVRAKLVRRAWDWPWSIASAHVGGDDASGLVDAVGWRQLLGGADWRQELTRREDDEVIARFRKWTNRGSPLGSDRFVAKLESLLGRRLRPLPVGRPRKKTTKPKKPKANSRQ